ncbi:MAG: Omp28-related outer membrane protein [Saprospiraceae bacterium]|nr:Omp28-related outer membrane protein [Saprospiraceae bacterium]
MRFRYIIILMLLPLLTEAQFEKKILVEWFTNTYCGICASKNPGLQEVYKSFTGGLHRMTIHPDVPYPQCSLHNFNKEDNLARESYYNIGGTPSLFLNGQSTSTSSALAFGDAIGAKLGQTSSISVEVDEVSSSQVRITIESSADLSGEYRLFVALLEKHLAFDAPNGESEHFDVLRDFVSSADGDPVNIPAAGESMNVSYSFFVPDGVDPDEAYILAFVQNYSTKEILNSGTKFDEISTSTVDASDIAELTTFPNPATDQLHVGVGKDFDIHKMEIFSQNGQLMKSVSLTTPEKEASVGISALSSGTYLLHVDLGNTIAISRFIKE